MKPPAVLILRVCRGKWERCEVGTWLADCYCQPPSLWRRLEHGVVDGEPTSVARNAAVAAARGARADVLFMVDADMDPAPGFFARALAFLGKHPGAVVVGSPYCGARPFRAVQVIGRDGERVGREAAAVRQGVELVRCVGTGLCACNVAAFDALEPPYFRYEYAGSSQEGVLATEDFAFCRRLTAAGGRVYCDWESWSGHWKEEAIGRPVLEPFETAALPAALTLQGA